MCADNCLSHTAADACTIMRDGWGACLQLRRCGVVCDEAPACAIPGGALHVGHEQQAIDLVHVPHLRCTGSNSNRWAVDFTRSNDKRL
jgi:hypothetical protein